jgi:zinc transport system substrate-binding protein
MTSKVLSIASALVLSAGLASAEVPKVSADIAPVHSLVSKVMNGLGKPYLIIPAEASPHEYQLKPSEAKSLQESKLVFWIGEDLTPWLEKGLSTLAKNATITTLLKAEGIELLDFREGALFEAHDHSDHDDHDDHDHGKHKKKDDHDDHDDHAGHEGHDHGEHDPHAWLSPGIAKAWLNLIAAKLSEVDPNNASTYFSNASSAIKDLDTLSDEINKILDPIRKEKFVVFHDAYQYFENHFNISASGAISLGDASDPSPARLKEIKERVEKEDIHCVLAEPQYNEGLVKAVIEGTHANNAIIDPLGVSLEIGPNLYDKLIRNLAINLSNCF